MSVLVLGSVAFDTIETPFGKAERVIGGAASFISRAIAFFNVPVQLISVVGGDFPKSDLEYLTGKGVDCSGIEIRQDEKSFFWHGKYGNDLNTRETLVTELNVLADFKPVVPEKFKRPELVMLGNFHPALQASVLNQLAVRPKLIVMDTMNFWMDVALDDLHNTLKLVDVLTINDEEARQLSGEYSLRKAAMKILTMGPKYLVIKKGEHGALLFHEHKVFYAPALLLEEVFDPTGAGDTFAGGFVGYLAKQKEINFKNMKAAVLYGSALASFCVEKFGVERLQSLGNKEVENRVKEFIQLVESSF